MGLRNKVFAIADLVLGNREMNLHFVADRMLILLKLGRSLRSEIIMIAIVG
jgi:hypothetical protein